MLIFFVHGVATRQTEYAKDLEKAIKDEMLDRDRSPPVCYPGFWGDLLSNTRRLWSILERDLQQAKSKHPQAENDSFLRYKDFREGLFSEFVGDFFAYFHGARGRKIRRKLSQQLEDFLTSNPNDSDLHIIAHSLGTVILWDALFSRRLDREPETQKLRMMLSPQTLQSGISSARLVSITTMGSPIVFANQMLGVRAEELGYFFKKYRSESPLRWTNIIHPADILAYPLQNSIADLCDGHFALDECLELRDFYLFEKTSLLETTTKIIGQSNFEVVWKAGEAHSSYLKGVKDSTGTLQAIIQTLLGESILGDSICDQAVSLLRQCPGVTADNNPENIKAAETQIVFKDGTGSITVFVNPMQIHHVYVFDDRQNIIFGAYVGWIDRSSLKRTLDAISQYNSQDFIPHPAHEVAVTDEH
jgi:hypothetical protein